MTETKSDNSAAMQMAQAPELKPRPASMTGAVVCMVVENTITIAGEPVTCVCGATSHWMVVHNQIRVAIGCVCGRLWWEPGITPVHLKPYDSNLIAEFPNINHAAASNGFGPFMVV